MGIPVGNLLELPRLSADPSTVGFVGGEMWYRTDLQAVRLFDGSSVVSLGSGGGGGGTVAPWRGKIHALWGDGNPAQQDVLWTFQNSAVSVAAPTATGIGTSVGRIVAFRFETAITVNRIRWFQLAALPAATFAIAIYQGANRIYNLDLMPAGAAGWNSAAPLTPFTIPADTLCWFGLSAKATGTGAVWRSPVSPIANSLGLASLPGNLNDYGPRFAQVALTLGVWPATLPAIAAAAYASAGTTGTIPPFFVDNNSAA